jgi:hypothetical protein
VRDSLSPWHVVRLAADAAAQGVHPLKQTIDIVDRDAEEDPPRSTGSAHGVGDQAQFRVTDLEADIKGRTLAGHAGCLCGSQQLGIEASRRFRSAVMITG